jgi:excisionase family DNA binding protein
MATKRSITPQEQTIAKTQARLRSLRGAAFYLGLSYWTVRGLIWDGQLPYVRVGRRILIDCEDLDDFIERCKQVES